MLAEGEIFDGSVKDFKKPWASTALMFVAMVMCLPIAWIARLVETHKKKQNNDESKPLLGGGKKDGVCSASVFVAAADTLLTKFASLCSAAAFASW